ncbi:phage portal protein [Parendozoicomonas sp. Alg238-R29]|uniref:phage portal protein n=1 Tax=Parendozoicomonas sp. Alg238-R29 TaxID=2993446 RepID=UPI00248EDF32|nr:phage portal protein [Parendozoicomonas sp. Alg238-R29]
MNARKSPILAPDGSHIVVVNSGGSYESAGNGPRSRTWNANSAGPNTAIQGSLNNLRNRSRAGHRNNPLIYSAIEKNVANEIGIGISLRSGCDDDQVSKEIDALWKETCKEIDPEGVLDFNGLQAQACRTRRLAGEVFIRRRYRRASADLTVPMQVQVLEPEFVPHDLNRTRKNGNRIVHGIEFNKRGQRVAYWMHREHPGESSSGNFVLGKLLRIPARDVIHHFSPTRAGQVRGVPGVAQGLLQAHVFEKYNHSELVRKETRAPFTGVVTRDDFDLEDDARYCPLTGKPLDGGIDDATTTATPGQFLVTDPGENVKLFDGDVTGGGYSDFMTWQSRITAIASDLPYELLTGDWSKVNDRLVRAILNEYRRAIEMCQNHLMIFQMCRGVWHWFIDAAVMSGALMLVDYQQNRKQYRKLEAQPHAWKYINPDQDLNAKMKEQKLGLSSVVRQNAERGTDAYKVLEETEEWLKRAVATLKAAGVDKLSLFDGVDEDMTDDLDDNTPPSQNPNKDQAR